jgi:hypothetical protein
MIAIPDQSLRFMQRKILDHILNQVPLETACHGFTCGRSIASNAQVHAGANHLISLDIEDFFPSHDFDRVVALFKTLKFSTAVATFLACICTDWDGETRYLPQGSPASPAIANLCAVCLDRSLMTFAGRRGYRYTRYADDLSFSTTDPVPAVEPVTLLRGASFIVRKNCYSINAKKTMRTRRGQCRRVTGVNVDRGEISVPRQFRKELRAQLHQLRVRGLPPEPERTAVQNQIQGKIAYIHMINADQAKKFAAEYESLFP